MAKIAIITDTHYGCRNDAKEFHRSFQRFYENIFFPTLKEEGVTHIIHAGDLVDRRKYVNFQTATELHNHFMQPIFDGGYETHIIAGNHDVTYKNSNQVNALKTLYGKSVNPNLHLYWDNPEEIDIGGLRILLSPWICDENREESLNRIALSTAPFLIGHFEISGFEMHAGSICVHGLDKSIFSKFDSVYSGHFHHPSEYGNIKYLGSPYETTWSDYNGKRGFHILDTETRDLKFYQNPYRVFHKIYYDDDEMTIEDVQNLDVSLVENMFIKIMVRKKNNPYVFDILLDRLQSAGAIDVKIVDETMRIIHDQNQVIDEAEDTPTIIKKYVNSIEVNIDKERVNSLLQELYRESYT